MTIVRGNESPGWQSASRATESAIGRNACARRNGSLSHPVEKPLLVWLAGKLPAWITPNHLTVFGLLGAVLAFGGFLLSNRDPKFLWLADLGIAANWFGDSLDGTLARVRKQERESYGFFVDHSTDVVSQLLIGFGLGLTPFLQFDAACLALIAYLALVAYMLIRERAFGVMQISFGMIGPTEVRLMIVGLSFWMLYGGHDSIRILNGNFTMVDLIVRAISVAIFFSLPIAIYVEARRMDGLGESGSFGHRERDQFSTMVRTAPAALNRDDRLHVRRETWQG